MKLSPKMTVVITAVGVMLVVVLTAVLLVLPQFGRLSELDKQVQASENGIDQAKTVLQSRQASRDEAAVTDAALLELVAAVPENPDLPSLIIEMQDLAYESNVRVKTIKPSGVTPGTGWLEMPLEITIDGDWADTVDFIQRLQQLTRQVRIKGVDSVLMAIDSQPTNVQTTIELTTYLIPSAKSSSTATPQPQPVAAPAQ